jgi:signal recognition particle subunit SRP54
VCADTYRLGAYEQLRQLAEKAKIPLQGFPGETDAVKVAVKGVEEFRNEKFDVILLDTAGRHKDEKGLMDEMKQIAAAVHPDEIILVVDGTIGQQAAAQAKAFHEATEFGSILLTKLDGSARGGGALSAVAATQVPIRFIGTGEGIDAIESFIPTQFVGRLLGMGDIQGLIQKYREVENTFEEKKQRDILKGRFTLEDMLDQMDSMRNMGPLKNVINMIPGLGYRLPDAALEQAEGKMKAWKFIIQSMTKDERENPKILNSSRMKRIANGSGTEEKDVKELVKQYETMRHFMKTMGNTRRMNPAMRRLLGGNRR